MSLHPVIFLIRACFMLPTQALHPLGTEYSSHCHPVIFLIRVGCMLPTHSLHPPGTEQSSDWHPSEAAGQVWPAQGGTATIMLVLKAVLEEGNFVAGGSGERRLRTPRERRTSGSASTTPQVCNVPPLLPAAAWFTAVCWALSIIPEAPSLAFLICGECLARVRLASLSVHTLQP